MPKSSGHNLPIAAQAIPRAPFAEIVILNKAGGAYRAECKPCRWQSERVRYSDHAAWLAEGHDRREHPCPYPGCPRTIDGRHTHGGAR